MQVGATWSRGLISAHLEQQALASATSADCNRAGHAYTANDLHRPLLSLHQRHNTHISQFAMAPVTFWESPRKYITWASRHKPAILWALVIGSFGPLIVVCNDSGDLGRT